ncbi:MAG: hypothetical protein WCQ50_01460 [Spirochaetota bacterium]
MVSFVLPLLAALPMVKGSTETETSYPANRRAVHGIGDPKVPISETETIAALFPIKAWEQVLVFSVGVGALISVPIFKLLTGLPPFMGILGSLALVWILTEALQRARPGEGHHHLRVAQVLKQIDLPSILFFVGILLSVAALEVTGILGQLSGWLENTIAIATSLLSASDSFLRYSTMSPW